MPLISANGIDIEYEIEGPESGPVVLLIMGLAAQLTFWSPEFIAALTGAGFRVIRFDNRDIGKSHKFHGKRAPNPVLQVVARMAGVKGLAPYSLDDMAEDARALLEKLGVGSAHIVGVSMGGMIAQVLAARAPEKIKSLTIIMSSTNNPALPRADAEITRFLISRPKKPLAKAEELERSMYFWGLIGTKQSGSSDDELRARLGAAYDRSHYPAGPRRQLAAIIDTGDLRKDYTTRIKAPALVIHGAADPLAPPAGGADIARNINGADLHMIEGMGHDLPKKFLPEISRLIVDHMSSHDERATSTA